MKLTNYIRDAFVKSVMNDVPQKDYSQQIQDMVRKSLHSTLPPKIKELATDPVLSRYLNSRSGSFYGVYTPYFGDRQEHLPVKDQVAIQKIKDLKDAQDTQRKDLETKLKAAAYGCTTSKALLELLPEFGKYLPAEEEKTCRTLPAVANLMADLSKAGWPKKEAK